MKDSLKILVVDDDESNLSLLGILLKQAGHEVVLVQEGQRAITIAQNALENSFDLSFVDMHLPDVSGTAVITAVRQSQPACFIVMATIDDDPDTIKAAYAADCDMFLVKPFDVTQLVEMVLQVRRGRRWIVDRLGMREYLGS